MTGPVWKTTFDEGGPVAWVEVEATRILAVGVDPGGELAVWYVAGPDRWVVELTPTGAPAPAADYVGTFRRGPLVFHGWARRRP